MRCIWKSTIWKEIANRLWYTFIDLDDFMEKKVQMKKDKYVEKKWWDSFRELEHKTLKNILELNWKNLIVLWWWTITFERNIEEINKKENKNMIFLDTNIKKIIERIEKDEASNIMRKSLTWGDVKAEINKVHEERKQTYKENADFIIDNNWTIEESTIKIINIINQQKDCLTITNFEESYLQKTFKKLSEIKEINYLELRIDILKDLNNLKEIMNCCPKNAIITNRIKQEWGEFTWTFEESYNIQKKIQNTQNCFIDIELQTIENIERPKLNFEKVILSYNNCERTPEFKELIDILNKMKKYNPETYKITVRIKTKEDIYTIYKLSDYFKENFRWKHYIFSPIWEILVREKVKIPREWSSIAYVTIDWEKTIYWNVDYKLYSKEIIIPE